MSKNVAAMVIAYMVGLSGNALAQAPANTDIVCRGMATEIGTNLRVLATIYETLGRLEREYTAILAGGGNGNLEQRQRVQKGMESIRADARDRIRDINEMKRLSGDLKCNQP